MMDDESFMVDCMKCEEFLNMAFFSFSNRTIIAVCSTKIIDIIKNSKNPQAAYEQTIKALKTIYDQEALEE
jgi:hypothetical protein